VTVHVIGAGPGAADLVLPGTLADIAGQVAAAGVTRTAVIVVGRVLAAGQFPDSHLYSTTRAR
jgi:precorrin-4/cobalt-precorrin-4 C11-methyltransferase